MNKYSYKVDGNTIGDTNKMSDNQAVVFATLKVANELAEANRLKRYELGNQVKDEAFESTD